MMKPLPTAEVAINDVLQHEQKLKKDRGITRSVQTVALAVRGGSQEGRKFSRCCKKENHTTEECWRLKNKKLRIYGGVAALVPQGESSTDSDTTSLDSKLNSKTRSVFTKENMNFSYEKMHKLRYLLQFVPSPSPSPLASPSVNHLAFFVAHSISQFPNYVGKFILSSFMQHKAESLAHSWILDTRASNHIACNIAFCSLKFSNSRSISLSSKWD
ncbi:unnamed protein product [Linum trigynum]|uniref:Uncharacterized protein n=1 Tax=Linum trigynum TaxID=586398 RepID=A0AAV2FLE4_9ROSI